MNFPQELLYNVSQFGQVAPGLEAEYILSEVNNVDREFNWSSEYMLEYLRANDGVYQRLKNVLAVLTHELLDTSVIRTVIVDPSTGRPEGEVNRITIDIHSSSDDSRDQIVKEIREVSLVRADTDPREIRAIQIPGKSVTSMLTQQLDRIGQAWIMDYGWLTIVIGADVSPDQLKRAMYLVNPRTDTRRTGYVEFKYQRSAKYDRFSGDYVDVPVELDYPWLIGTASPETIPLQHTDPLTNSDIVTGILQLNPEYDLGGLMAWLNARANICSNIRATDMYQLARYSGLVSLSVTGSTIVFNMSRQGNVQDVISYLTRLGLSPREEDNRVIVVGRGPGVRTLGAIYNSAITVGFCLLPFKAVM